jgi:hypothetical protein
MDFFLGKDRGSLARSTVANPRNRNQAQEHKEQRTRMDTARCPFSPLSQARYNWYKESSRSYFHHYLTSRVLTRTPQSSKLQLNTHTQNVPRSRTLSLQPFLPCFKFKFFCSCHLTGFTALLDSLVNSCSCHLTCFTALLNSLVNTSLH